MKYKVILLTLCSFYCEVNAQDSSRISLRVYSGWEPTGDHISADATIGTAFRISFNKVFYIESFVRVGYGGVLSGDSFPRYPENYVGKFQSYAFEGEIMHDPIHEGIGNSKINDSHLFFLIHGYQFGASTAGKKYRGYAGIGVSVGYMDYQGIQEAGDAIFEYEGDEIFVWYTVPGYQRGLGLQWSASLGIEKCWSSWYAGVRADLDAGGLGSGALGTRLSLSVLVGVSLQ